MEKLENYIELCEKIESVVYSNSFYPLSQIKNLSHKNIKFIFKGLNEESEKKIIAIAPKDFPEEYISFPVKYFKIIKKSKFISLEHKHYLGSILSLGIKREILGDLIVKDEICYAIIIDDMFNFLKENLEKINSSPIEILEILEDEVPRSEFREITITLTSLRLDSVVAELTNLSRTASVSYIALGNVQLNYEVEKDKSHKIEIGDVLIIKKYGKFIIFENKGLNKKDKIKILIKKYV